MRVCLKKWLQDLEDLSSKECGMDCHGKALSNSHNSSFPWPSPRRVRRIKKKVEKECRKRTHSSSPRKDPQAMCQGYAKGRRESLNWMCNWSFDLNRSETFNIKIEFWISKFNFPFIKVPINLCHMLRAWNISIKAYLNIFEYNVREIKICSVYTLKVQSI